MPGILATLRSLFVGSDDASAPVRRAGTDRIDAASSMPVPADSQEIVTMAREFRAFLDLQDQRQQELARVVGQLPQSMGALPELVRQQTRLADLVAQQLMYTRQRDEHVEKTLARITQGVEQQRDVMSLVQQQLDLNHESAMKVADGVTTLASAVVQLQSTTDRSSAALQGLLEKTAERDAGVQKLHTALQNWLLFVAIVSCMTLVGGVVLAWIALESARTAPLPAPTAVVAPEQTPAVETDAAPHAAPAPAGTAIPALGGAPQPASGTSIPATGGAAPQ
jgi:ketosteroid isomerase-like protein